MKSKTFPADLLHLLTRATTVAALFVLFAAGLQVNAQRNRTALTSKTSTLAVKTTTDPGTTSIVAANPSADIDQCGNDPAPSPHTDGCNVSSSDWVNGNLGASKSVYIEGDSIPYRIKFDNLSLSSHTVTIEWDTTKSSKHAIDYLTTFNQTVANANPCLGVTGCGSSTTFPIPDDPQVTGGDVTPIAGVFTLYGGTITSVSAYSYSTGAGFIGDKSASITITFTASVANPVLAWGGHIATRADWGFDNSAIAISGSPYHTRLLDLDGSGGNQDRSLSADASIFPAHITIIKIVHTLNGSGVSSQFFNFTNSLGLSIPGLQDDFAGDGLDPAGGDIYTNTTDVIAGFGTNQTISESAVSGWSNLPDLDCSVTTGGNNVAGTVTAGNGSTGGTSSGSGLTATFNLKEGNYLTCTWTNTQGQPTAASASISGRVTTRTGSGISGATVSAFDGNTGVTKSVRTNSFGYYTITGLTIQDFIVMKASAKGYTFSSGGQEFVLGGDLAGVNFQAQ